MAGAPGAEWPQGAVWPAPLSGLHGAVGAMITNGRAPFAAEIFAALEAWGIVEQEVRVTRVGEGDVPVRICQREPLG